MQIFKAFKVCTFYLIISMTYDLFFLCIVLQIVLKHSEHPPIMADSSWTRAVPFKEVAHHRTPSESIANNYTLSASGLKIRNLSKIKSPRPKSILSTWQFFQAF